MADTKKNGKFVTTIIIGGALGSLAAWIFGNKQRREVVSEKAQEYYESSKGKIDSILNKPRDVPKGWFSRWFGKK